MATRLARFHAAETAIRPRAKSGGKNVREYTTITIRHGDKLVVQKVAAWIEDLRHPAGHSSWQGGFTLPSGSERAIREAQRDTEPCILETADGRTAPVLMLHTSGYVTFKITEPLERPEPPAIS